MEYHSPGKKLSEVIARGEKSPIMFLQNHGLVVSSSSFEGAWYTTRAISDVCKQWIADKHEDTNKFISEAPMFPDAVMFQEDKDVNNKLASLILSCGLTPKPLTKSEISEILSMEEEKYRSSLK